MIPEIDPVVESQVDAAAKAEAIVKRLVEDSRPAPPNPKTTIFSNADRTMFGGVTTATADGQPKTLTADDLYAMAREQADRRFERDVELVEALNAIGALTIVNPFLSEQRIVVTLPQSFERAVNEAHRRRSRRQDMVQQVGALMRADAAPPIFLDQPPFTNLCSEIPLP